MSRIELREDNGQWAWQVWPGDTGRAAEGWAPSVVEAFDAAKAVMHRFGLLEDLTEKPKAPARVHEDDDDAPPRRGPGRPPLRR